MKSATSTETAKGFRREVVFHPAYDKRNSDPNKNYGIHGVNLTFYLHGPKGVIQFVIYTNWQLPHVQAEFDARPPHREYPYLFHSPQPADIGYHSPVPMYEGQTPMKGECSILGGKCYYDGSSLMAEDVFKVLVEGGDEALWKELERRYNEMLTERVEA